MSRAILLFLPITMFLVVALIPKTFAGYAGEFRVLHQNTGKIGVLIGNMTNVAKRIDALDNEVIVYGEEKKREISAKCEEFQDKLYDAYERISLLEKKLAMFEKWHQAEIDDTERPYWADVDLEKTPSSEIKEEL